MSTMSEKIDELIESNAEIRQSYKTLISLIKGFIAGCSLVIILIITFMIDTRSDIATIKATLATKDNIVKVREDMKNLEIKIRGELGGYISLNSYIATEGQRNEVVSNLFIDFGRIIGLKEEDLEWFRRKAVKEQNGAIKLGTTRGT